MRNVPTSPKPLVHPAANGLTRAFCRALLQKRLNVRGVASDLRTISAVGLQNWRLAKELCWTGRSIQKTAEIARLLHLVRQMKPQHVLEIGVNAGGTLRALCNVCPPSCHIIGVDLNDDTHSGRRQDADQVTEFVTAGLNPQQVYTMIWGDSHARETFAAVSEALGGNQLDFLFIDGDHSYEGARSDFYEYGSLVREGGLVAFHDIVPDHKTRYGKDTVRFAGGVHQLWSELKPRYRSWEFVEDPLQDGLGIGVLEHRK